MLEHLSIYAYIFFWITFSISMYIMCVCLFSALSHRLGALQISIIITSSKIQIVYISGKYRVWCRLWRLNVSSMSLVKYRLCISLANTEYNADPGVWNLVSGKTDRQSLWQTEYNVDLDVWTFHLSLANTEYEADLKSRLYLWQT